ncbi:MAG: MFS transporter [Acidiferrobacter sp.]
MKNASQSIPLPALFAGVALALGLGSFEGMAVFGILPYVAGGLATSSDHALWTVTYFIVSWSLGITLMPWTTARFGARRVFQGAVLIATLGTLVSALTHNLWVMLLSRVWEGIGAGLLVPLSQSLFLRHSTPARHGMVTMLWSNAMLVPFFIGPTIGGWFAVHMNFRLIFWVTLPLWGLAWFLGRIGIPEGGEQRDLGPFDWVGFGLLYAGLMSLQVVLDQGEQYGWWHAVFIQYMTLATLSFLLLFTWWEKRAEFPLLQFHFLRQRNYWLGLLLLCLGWSLFMGWAAEIPFWAAESLGFNGYWSGVLLLPMGLAAVPLSALMGRLQGLLGLRRLAALSFLLFAAAYGVSDLSPQSGLAALFWPMFLQGLGLGVLFVPLTMIILSGIPVQDIPKAATTSNFIRVFSANIGVTLISVYVARGAAMASDSLASGLSAYAGPAIVSPQALARLVAVEANTLSIDNLLRFSMWLCLLAAAIAYVFLIPPRTLAAPSSPQSYVEEGEDEVASV